MKVTRRFFEAVKLSDRRHYELALEAGMTPSAFSRVLHGIDKVKPGDPRILKIAEIVGVDPEEALN